MELIIQKNCQLLICLIGCILWAIILASGTLHVSRPEAMPVNVTGIMTKIVASRMQCSHLCARTKDCKFTAVTETATGEFKCDLLSAEVVEINPSAFEPSSPDHLQELSQVLSTQEWSSWTPWSVCTVSCGCGTVIKTRTCFLGKSCNGTDQQSRTCDTGVSCTVIINCGFETDMCGLTNVYDDGDRTWNLMTTATTTTAHTGQGYLYFNGGIYPYATVEVLIPKPGCYTVAFYYHMKGDGPRKLYVFAKISNGTKPFFRSINGNQGDVWHYFSQSFEIPVEAKFRMYAHDGSEVNDQFAIDDLVLRSSCCN